MGRVVWASLWLRLTDRILSVVHMTPVKCFHFKTRQYDTELFGADDVGIPAGTALRVLAWPFSSLRSFSRVLSNDIEWPLGGRFYVCKVPRIRETW
jgi:hypothetical protein